MPTLELADGDGLPENIGKVKSLTVRGLRNRKLTSLPVSIVDLKNLEHLTIVSKSLSSLPDSIGKLKKLTILRILSGKLTSLPVTIGNIQSLRDFYVMKNMLTSVPDSIGNLRNLRKLGLGDNHLTSLPTTIGNLKNLTLLDLTNNLFTSLPETLGHFKNLKMLYLNGNPLKSIPSSFKYLPEDIKISYNGLRYSKSKFIDYFTPRRVTINTELINSSILNTNRISSIPPKKRVYINKPSEYNGYKLRRLYDLNGLKRALEGRNAIRLHGNLFTTYNLRPLVPHFNIVNKNVYLRNLKNRLLTNVPLNNFMYSLNMIKKSLPNNVNASDVNSIVRAMKPQLLQKIVNKLRTSPSNTRMGLINNYKSHGLINQTDVTKLQEINNK